MNVEHIPAEDVDMLPCGADWQSRHLESEKRKAEIRDRIHKQAEQGQKTAKDYFRPAKPTPSIYDSDLKRVAVYARVSTSSEEQISSIENQTLYYTKKIAETENWNLQDIYSDEGKSGTSLRKRDAFKRMMRDAKDQKMDLIICASISRFARNFSDCMTQIAALKTMHPAHPIGVYFETENIYTLNPKVDMISNKKSPIRDNDGCKGCISGGGFLCQWIDQSPFMWFRSTKATARRSSRCEGFITKKVNTHRPSWYPAYMVRFSMWRLIFDGETLLDMLMARSFPLKIRSRC